MLSDGGGGIKISTIAQKDRPPESMCPSDQYLLQKFPKETHDPLVYGGVKINKYEKGVLSLPPKFAVMEHISIKDLKLELKRGATKGRWHQRSAEEKAHHIDNEGEQLDEHATLENERKEVIQTNHWIKGRDTLDFTGVRPTQMKFNSRYILPGPIRTRSWEVKWRNFELEALRVGQEVNEKLQNTYGKRVYLNLDYADEKGLKQVIKKKAEGKL